MIGPHGQWQKPSGAVTDLMGYKEFLFIKAFNYYRLYHPTLVIEYCEIIF